jgi:putative serine protease PepD
VPQLLEGGAIERAYLGVSSTVHPTEDGAVVATIAPGGPASKSELRIGDRITSAGDRAIAEPSDLSTAILDYKPGDRVELRVVRDGEQRTIEVQLGTRPDQPARG